MNTHSLRHGFSLFMSLIILLMMSLIAVATTRNIDMSTMVSMLTGFKKTTINETNLPIDLAIAWLDANKNTLVSNNPSRGYFATDRAGRSDFFNKFQTNDVSVDWIGDKTWQQKGCQISSSTVDSNGNPSFVDATGKPSFSCSSTNPYKSPSGNTFSFIIHRLCTEEGDFNPGSTIRCATETGTLANSSSNSTSYGSYSISGKTRIYYRITSRVSGPKGVNTYAQSMLLMEY